MNTSRLQIGQRYYEMFRGRFRVYEICRHTYDSNGICVGTVADPIFSLDTFKESEARKSVYSHNGWGGNKPCENRGMVVVMFYRYNEVAKRSERLVLNTYKKTTEEATVVAKENGYSDGKYIKFWTV